MVELKEITRDNYEECLRLRVAAGQRAFVSSTEHSLAQAWVFRETGAVAGNEVEMKLTLACDSQSAARRACQAHSARV